MFSEKAAMFLSGIKCKPMVVYFYIGLIVTYDLAAPVLAWKQTWTPNSVVGNEGKLFTVDFQSDRGHFSHVISLWLGTTWTQILPVDLQAAQPIWLTVMFLSFRTDRSGQTVQTQIRLLLSGSTLFAIPSASFGCITLTKSHLVQLLGWYSKFSGVRNFRIFTVHFPQGLYAWTRCYTAFSWSVSWNRENSIVEACWHLCPCQYCVTETSVLWMMCLDGGMSWCPVFFSGYVEGLFAVKQVRNRI